MSLTHDAVNNQFTLHLEGFESVLQYRKVGSDTVDFYRTFVPEEQRGNGYAANLVDAGFAWAGEQNLNIEVSCSYARKRLDAAPEGKQ